MITGYATINSALQAMQIGAFDYIAKPFTREELRKVVRRAANLVGVSQSAGRDSRMMSGEATNAGDSEIMGIGEHTWLMRQENGDVVMGVERPLLYSLGKIQTIYLPAEGDEIRQGSVYFQIFSADLRSQSLLSPLTGRVVEVNQSIIDDPSRLVEDPYGEGWLIRLDPEKFDEEIKMLGR
jgi:glycine cleavage system H protein